MALRGGELGLWKETLEDCDLTQQGSCRPPTLLKRVRSEFGPGSEGPRGNH